jgi:hypothetical protein
MHHINVSVSDTIENQFTTDGVADKKFSLSVLLAQKSTVDSAINALVELHKSLTNQIDSQLDMVEIGDHQLDALLTLKVRASYTIDGLIALKRSSSCVIESDLWNNLLYDKFSGVNEPLSTHPMDIGPGWTVSAVVGLANNLAIYTNNHVQNNESPSWQRAWSDAGSANHTLEFFFQAGSSMGGMVEVLSRLADTGNFWVGQAIWSSAKQLNLYKVVAGVSTLVGSGHLPTLISGNFYTLKIITTAATVTLEISGTGIITTTIGPISDTTLASNTKFGFGIRQDNSANIFFSRGWSFRVC